MSEPGRCGDPRLAHGRGAVSVEQPRRGLPQRLSALAALAVGVHLFGLYRPTGPPSLSWFPHVDKLEHLIGFGAPVCLLLLAGRAWCRRAGRRSVTRRFRLVVIAVFAAHGVVSELIQHFYYTSRTGDPFDTLADWVGVAFGATLARLAETRRHSAAPAPVAGEASR